MSVLVATFYLVAWFYDDAAWFYLVVCGDLRFRLLARSFVLYNFRVMMRKLLQMTKCEEETPECAWFFCAASTCRA